MAAISPLPLREMHMAAFFQNPHQPYKGKLNHHPLSHENGNLKGRQSIDNQNQNVI